MDIVERLGELRLGNKEYDVVVDAIDEIERLREDKLIALAAVESENAFYQEEIERLRKENAQLRELLQKWLGNCFVDVYGNGVTFGMGVRKVWAETRAALKEGE